MRKVILSAILFVATSAYSACPQFYPMGKVLAPANTVELCNSFYVSRYDANNKAVVLTSEYWPRGTKLGATRINAFHSDSRVKNGPTNSDYTGTGYDKGHMVSAENASSASQMNETFLLTNMTPQEPTLNRNSWKMIEEKVRKDFAAANANFKVVNIAIYKTPSKRIGKGVPVPVGYWKIVYNEATPTFYYADNKPNAKVTLVPFTSIDTLVKNATNF